MGLFITKYLQTLSHFVRTTKCHFLHTIWISYILKNMWTCTHTHLHAHMHTLIYKQYIGQKGLLFIIFMVLLKLFETQMSLLFPVVITLAFTDQCREKVQNIHDEEATCKCFLPKRATDFVISIYFHISSLFINIESKAKGRIPEIRISHHKILCISRKFYFSWWCCFSWIHSSKVAVIRKGLQC